MSELIKIKDRRSTGSRAIIFLYTYNLQLKTEKFLKAFYMSIITCHILRDKCNKICTMPVPCKLLNIIEK